MRIVSLRQAAALSFLLAGSIGLVLGTTGCGKKGPEASPAAKAAKEKVRAAAPVKKVVHRVIDQPAFVEALEETPLFARISGYIRKVNVDIGDPVTGPVDDAEGKLSKPGKVLAELFVPEMEEDLHQKEALVDQARAEENQAQASLEVAKALVVRARAGQEEAAAGLDRAQANLDRWDSEFKRIEKLGGSILDKQTVEEARNQHRSAQASLKEAQARISSAKAGLLEFTAKETKALADIKAAAAKVKVALAEKDRAQAMLGYTRVHAPYDGVIVQRNVHRGFFLTGTGVKPLFVIARTDKIRIVAEIPEAAAILITSEATADIRFDALKGDALKGVELKGIKVTRSAWSFDARARTLRCEIELDNPEKKIRPGMYAYVTLRAALEEAFTLPVSAVVNQAGETFCYLLKEDRAIKTPLKVGTREADTVQVLKKLIGVSKSSPGVWEDFTGEEAVIVGNTAALSDGQEVLVEERK